MNSATHSAYPSQTLNLTLILETLKSGRMVVSVLELPDYQIEAETKEEAIASIHHQLSERFQNADVTVLELSIAIAPNTNASTNANTSNNPGTKLFGLYKDDPDFAEISAAIRAEREADDDTEVDPSMYLREKV